MRSTPMRQLWVLMGTGFVDMVGFFVVYPLLPFYGKHLGASALVIGALISAFAFAQMASAPLWGRFSDRYGRRPMILLGLVVSAAAYVLFGLADSVAVLLLSRLAQGAGGGTTGVVQAYVSDVVEPRERAKALGWLTSATSAGVMVGPLVGTLAIGLGPEAPGFVAAGLCLTNVLLTWLWLPESSRQRDKDEAGSPVPRRSIRRAIDHVLRSPGERVSKLIYVYATGMMAFMAMNGVIVLYLNAVFGVTKGQIGWFYFLMGGASVVMRALLLGPVVHRLGEVRTLRLGALSLVLGLAVIPLPANVFLLAVVALLVPMGTALLFPATTSLVSQYSPRREVGQSLSVQQAFGGVSRMLGPLWATAIFQYVGVRSPFWIASGLMVLVGILTLHVERPGRGGSPVAAAETVGEEASRAGGM